MQKKTSILCLAILCVLLTGCIKEKLVRCKTGVDLYLEYTYHNKGEDLFGSEVDHVTAFVYDENGELADYFQIDVDQFEKEQIMTLPLESGTYDLLIYGGTLENYRMVGIDQNAQHGQICLSDFRLILENVQDQSLLYPVAKTPSDLYTVYLPNVNVVKGKITEVPASLKKFTSRINVTVVNEDGEAVFSPGMTGSGDPGYQIYFNTNSTMFTYMDAIAAEAPVYRFNPDSSAKADAQSVSIKMTRLVIGQEARMVLANQENDDILLNRKLVDLLLEHKDYNNQSDLDREDLFDIEIVVGVDTQISITINGWEIKNIIPVL